MMLSGRAARIVVGMTTPIWLDPRYRRVFRNATCLIATLSRKAHWAGPEDDVRHQLVLLAVLSAADAIVDARGSRCEQPRVDGETPIPHRLTGEGLSCKVGSAARAG